MRRMFSKNQLVQLIDTEVLAKAVDALVGNDIDVEDITCGDITSDGDVSVGGDLTITGSINGEEHPSVKPIFCHPLTIYTSTDITLGEKTYSFLGTAMIYNNNDEPINTITKLYNASLSFHRLQVNGVLFNKTDAFAIEVVQLYVADESIRPVGVNLSNATRYDELFTGLELYGKQLSVIDGANQIN